MSHDGRERGATLVEAAFALPIFFVLVLGLVDFGLVGFNDNQAGNAARDGARVGMIDYLEADVAGSSDRLAIEAAIEQNLPGRTVGTNVTVEVSCIEPDGSPLPACADAEVDRDRIRVRVSWEQPFLSPVAGALGFGSATLDGDSAMVIVGAPVSGGTVTPEACDVTSVSVSPNPATRESSGPSEGELQSDLTVELAGTGSCGDLTVRVVQGGIDETICVGPSCVSVPLVLAGDATDDWTAGAAAVEVTGDDSIVAAFTVLDPVVAVCSVTGITVTPNPVERETSGANAGQLKSNLAVGIAGSGICPDLEVVLTAPNGSTATVCSAGTCLFGNNFYAANANNFWTAGTASAAVLEGGSTVATSAFSVSDVSPCAVSIDVTPDPAIVVKNGNDAGELRDVPSLNPKRKLDVTVTASGPCADLTVTLITPNGSPIVLCDGAACVGTLFYVGEDSTWGIAGGSTTASATVSGDGNASTTFQIEE